MNNNKNKLQSKHNTSISENFFSSNPLSQDDLVAKINHMSGSLSSNKLYGGYNQNVGKPSSVIDYPEFIKDFNKTLARATSPNKLLSSIHSFVVNRIGGVYSAVALINENSKCINIKLLDKNNGIYSSRVFMNEAENEIVQAIEKDEIITIEDNSFLKIPYLTNSHSIIIPIKVNDKIVGATITGDFNIPNHIELYSMMSNYYAMFYANSELQDKVVQNNTIDNLTNLNSHRRFQELLSEELNKAKENDTNLSVLIFDINDITSINNEFGHSKGDEVIKLVADKIHQNIRKQDIAGRYGGDEIAVILPKMDTNEAKYLAEYITYTISCSLIDEVGPVKISVGVASYPTDAIDREKLLILTEQGVFVSKNKGYKNGMSTIVSAQDYDFWDDASLNSFASVVAKRHSQLGVNFEEALIEKFQGENIITQNHMFDIVTSLAGAIDAKDEYTKDHSTSVSRYSVALAKALNLPDKDIERIKLGALLHDIGKIGIPENILRKPTQLTEKEWNIIKQHPVIGAEKILQPNQSLHDLIPIVKYHHEKWDGSGYPEKLKGKEIPLFARIVAIADAYHALISDRPYRKGMSIDKACEILKKGAGKEWDKELVRQFVSIANSIGTKI